MGLSAVNKSTEISILEPLAKRVQEVSYLVGSFLISVLYSINDFYLKTIELLSKLKPVDIILIVCALIVIVFFFLLFKGRRNFGSVTLNMPFNLGNMTYELSEQDRVVAWKLYTQLKTRKAALIFDEENDVIADVYDSLYELFPITRELLTNLPVKEIGRTDGIADLIFRVQNDGLRPHLTKWQADFRNWWEKAKGNNKRNHWFSKTNDNYVRLQDIQKKYPQYNELVKELKEMNIELNKYAEDLLIIAKATKGSKEVKVERIIPSQPSS